MTTREDATNSKPRAKAQKQGTYTPTLCGYIDVNGRVTVHSDPEVRPLVDAYFHSTIESLESTPIANWPHGSAIWQLVTPVFRVHGGTQSIPDDIRRQWFKDAEESIRGLRNANNTSPYTLAKCREVGGHSWQFRATFTAVPHESASAITKTLDLAGETGHTSTGDNRNQEPDEMPHCDQDDNSSNQRLLTAVDNLKQVIDSAETAFQAGDGAQFGTLCDEYTKAAKSLAAVLLEERVKRSFIGKIDPETGKSTESLADKITHAQQIRDFLSPWNFGFALNGGRAQIQGYNNGGPLGNFRLVPYGGKMAVAETARWETVKKVLLSPTLVEVTEEIYRSPQR